MSNYVNDKSELFSELQADAVGEILNISMGSAATAVSELLSSKVWITTPKVEVKQVKNLGYKKLEPAVCVKIIYVSGITGVNMMILKQDDVQLILNQLIGMPLEISPDFKFDELNISAVAEVMNQMMGASATALSDMLGTPIDISTPTPYIMEDVDLSKYSELDSEETVVAVTFNLTVDGIVNSEFMSVLSIDLARNLADKMLDSAGEGSPQPEPEPVKEVAPPKPVEKPIAPPPVQTPQAPVNPPTPQIVHQEPPRQAVYTEPPVNIQTAQFQSFDTPNPSLSSEQKDNLQLLMNVPLQISVEIGTAKRKVKDILEFSQGTIIELERQAGAPVDVIVNGNLIARGDVVVIDDNFAVRITEIVKSKFMDSLGSKE